MKFWEHPLVKNIGPEQINSLFATTPVTATGRYINTIIIAYCLYGIATTAEIIAWIGINFLGATYALYRWKCGNSNRTRPVTKHVIKQIMFISVYFTIPWVFLTLLYLGNSASQYEAIILLTMAAMAAVGSIQLSRVYPAAIAYLTLLTLPVILKGLYLSTEYSLLIAISTAVYISFLLMVIRQTSTLSIKHSQTIKAYKQQINELDQAKADMQKYAMEDPLTELPNRREFQTRLDAAVSEAQRQGSSVSLLICDLDHFKNINDISGHTAGDVVLIEVAKRLKKVVRDYDFVARIGGDEFAIIAKHHTSPKDTADFTNRILDAVNDTIDIDSSNVRPGISIGISMLPYDAKNTTALLSHADLALQRGKAAGRGQYNFFDQQMESQLTSDQAMETDLRLALVEDEFELVYQPKIAIRTGKLEGFEALIRWNHPSGRTIAPGEFFPVAEDRGLMPYISDFVINQVFKDMLAWKAQGIDPGRIAVNIHPTQIKDKNRMKRIVRDIERNRLDPSNFYLEITEGCVIGRGTEDVPELLTFLRNNGLRISLDDFGTGFASLSHLKDLPVDELKIDRGFINDLLNDASNRAIVHAMVKLASSLGITTVAEGIETQEQHTVLLAMGCTTGQGYLYNRPLSMYYATNLIKSAAQTRDTKEIKYANVTSSKILPQDRLNRATA